MSWKLSKSETLTLPKAKALEFAAKHAGLPRSPVERDVDPGRVKKLAAILRNGLALPFNWAIVKYDGQAVRMNGQHSSAAIIEVGSELPDSLTFHLDHYEAKERKSMVELFRQFDQRWSSRTGSDIAGAFQGLVPELVNCNRKVGKVAAEAISWVLRTVDGAEGIPTGDDTYDLLHKEQYTPFVLWLNGIINGRKELLRKEVVAAMYKTYDRSQSGATKFWREISFGPDYFTDDMMPGAVLIGELARASEDKDFRDKEFETAATYYKKAVKAWGAFCAGQRIATLKVTKGKGWPDVSGYGEKEEAA
jgi:hypothetical protein